MPVGVSEFNRLRSSCVVKAFVHGKQHVLQRRAAPKELRSIMDTLDSGGVQKRRTKIGEVRADFQESGAGTQDIAKTIVVSKEMFGKKATRILTIYEIPGEEVR